jgi:PAS domain S-box-containing protein
MDTKLELYQKVIPLAGLGIWDRNLLTGETYWNDVMRNIYEVDDKYTPILENSMAFYREPERLKILLQKAIDGDSDVTGEFELTTTKGTSRFVKVRVSAEYTGDTCIRLFGTLEDITKQAHLISELEDREMRFTQAFDHAPIGMALVSPTGQWIKVNHSLRQLMGYEEQEFLEQTFQDFTHPDDLNADLEQMHQLLAKKISSYTMEKRYFRKNGQVIWALLSVTLVRYPSGAPNYFISQIRDITGRKKDMETIREQNARLLNFAHIVSHNLRSHTGNLQTLTDMLVNETNEAEKQNLLDMLILNAANLQDTLSHLNEVVFIQNSASQSKKTLELEKETQRVLTILDGSIRQNKAQIVVDIPVDLQIDYNPAYLESILLNLIGNSLKYHRPGIPPEININARLNLGEVLLQIKDNGLGVDLKLHGHKLFGMYKTFHGNDDARGIGLFLVKNQIEAMGGKITAQSQPNKGMTFNISII